MIRVFGVGNVLLCDDGIGVKVCEKIKTKYKSNKDIDFIIGETDVMYCLDFIEKMQHEDTVIIVDSTCFGNDCGKIKLFKFEECDRFFNENMDNHNENLLKVIRKDYRHLKGYLIGIEVGKIEYSLDISKELESKFKDICVEVNRIIEKIYLSNIKE